MLDDLPAPAGDPARAREQRPASRWVPLLALCASCAPSTEPASANEHTWAPHPVTAEAPTQPTKGYGYGYGPAHAESDPAPPPVPLGAVRSDGQTRGCNEAMERWLEQTNFEKAANLRESAAELRGALNKGTYLNECDVPDGSAVSICTAVLKGAVHGVTVELDQARQEHADCVAAKVESLEFPVAPRMLLGRTRFPAQR